MCVCVSLQAIEDALCMSEEERRERHRQNYMHVQVSEVTVHTALLVRRVLMYSCYAYLVHTSVR